MTERQLDYADNVRIASQAPPQLRPGRVASVCGFRQTEEETTIEGVWVSEGTLLVLVEFEDGTSVEVPRDMLEVADADRDRSPPK